MTKIICNSTIDAKVFSDFSFFNCYTLKHRILGLILFPFVMFGFGMLDTLTGSLFLLKLFSILGFVFPILYVIFYIVSLKKQILRFNLKTAQQIYSLEILNDGVHVKNKTEKAIYNWNQIYRIYITEKYMYLYITKARSFILPYSDLQDCTKDGLINAVKSLYSKDRLFFVTNGKIKKSR